MAQYDLKKSKALRMYTQNIQLENQNTFLKSNAIVKFVQHTQYKV